MPLHLDEFQKEQLTGYVQTVPLQRKYLLRDIMPQEPVFDINFAYNVIEGHYAQMASLTGWNASAPLRDTKDFKQAFAEVAKIQHQSQLDEKQLLAFNRPRTDQEKAKVIDYVYDTTDDLVMGVDDAEEFLRAQVVYTGKLKYADKENDMHIDADFGIPKANRIKAEKVWSDAASTPLEDIQKAVEQYKKENQRRKPIVMHMTSATEANLLKNEQVRTQVYGENAGKRLLTKDDLQNVFTALSLPPYQVNDDVVNTNDGEQQLLADDTVALIGADLGKTFVGPLVETNYEPGKFVEPQILTNPPRQIITVGEACFPGLQKPQSIVLLSV